MSTDYDVLVVGSGFGGSVAALRLAEKGYRVGVLEAGKRWRPRDFPSSNWRLRKALWFPRLGMRGIQRLSLLDDVLVLAGSGVGGGSLVYANTLLEPDDAFYGDPQWGHITDWKRELAPYYDRARRMLGAVEADATTASDAVIREVARRFDAEDTFRPTTIGVYRGEPGRPVPDPYFGGAGPERVGCTACGACMVGCRVGAKNTLDRNYLHLAEGLGADVHAEHEVVDLRRDGATWTVETRRPGAWIRRRPRAFTARHVVMAAGALGTTRLLLRLRDEGRLPGISPTLGHLVRTNSESIVGAIARSTDTDYSRGVAITSSFHPDPDTRIEPVRYPPGSNVMGLLATILVDGDGRLPQWVRFLGQVLRHPVRFLRSLSVRHWSERGVIVLAMQSRDNSIRLERRRRRLRTRPGHGEPAPRWLPVANRAAREAAEVVDGDPAGSINESMLGIPVTAHILGGAVVSSDERTGVIDPYHRVWGEPGLHVVDGAAVAANLGANPSLTITAMAERAMAMWPNAGDDDPRPDQAEPYRAIEPVAPRREAAPIPDLLGPAPPS
ncbi:MAG: GMC family oxidoreductase [Acidimicrobiia bacterium]|nr:GMC family oxidoreductase [Acidimicrobiia bacterium]